MRQYCCVFTCALLAFTQGAWAQDPSATSEDVPACSEMSGGGTCRDEKGEIIETVLLACARRISPVTIWGDRPEDAPGSVSGLEADAIANAAADHPAEVLNTLPGVNIQMNSGQEHLIAIRSPVLTGGAGQGSFLILENGVPVRSPAFGNVNALLEPQHEAAEYIEIVRGPGSAKYGSNAVHGLVNVILSEPGEGSALDASYGSLGRWKANGAYDLSETMRASLSLQKDTGWRDNTDISQQKLSLTGAYEAGEWALSPWLSVSNLEQETAGFLRGPDAYKDRDTARANPNPEAYRNALSLRAAMRMQRDLGMGELILTPFARTQSMQFRQHFLPYKGIEKNGHTGGGLMARYDWQAGEALSLRIGADTDFASGFLKEVQPAPFGFFPGDRRFPEGVHYDYSVDTKMGALWGEAEWYPVNDVTILAGLRGEAHSYDYTSDAPDGINGRFNVAADRSDDFSFATPKLGIIWQPGEISYYANYARGARAPQASDLYRLQSLQTPGEVKVETLDSFEIGARGLAFDGRLSFDIAAYFMDKDNFFFRDSNGLNVPDGSTRHKGIESAFFLELEAGWSLEGQLSWSDQTYTFDRVTRSGSETITSGNAIDTAPEWLGDMAVVWTGEAGSWMRLEAEYIGDYFTNPANTRRYDGHTLLHLRGGYVMENGTEIYGIIRNLTDETYADRADFAFGSERYFPGEPLNVTLGVRRSF